MGTVMDRILLDWRNPPLTQTVNWLVGKYSRKQWLDLSSLLLVFNSGHAQSRLQERLVEYCETNQIIYTPPTFETVGKLPEQLYQPQRPFASSLIQRLVWIKALESMDQEQLSTVVPSPPKSGEWGRWLAIVQSLGQLHNDLASEMKRFFSGRDAVAQMPEKKEDLQEILRWDFLVAAQMRYWELMTENELWDRQTARMIAVDRKECRTQKQIVMVGTVDLNQMVRAMLKQVQEQVTILTFCAPDEHELYDDLGCLTIEKWCQKDIEISDQHIIVVDKPLAQAQAVIAEIDGLGAAFRADEITIGIPDAMVVPYLQSELINHGISCRFGRGQSMQETSFFRLVDAISAYCTSRDYGDFASLIRHPEIAAHVQNRIGNSIWLATVDQWFEKHLQSRIFSPESVVGSRDSHLTVTVQVVVQVVTDLLQPLLVDSAQLNQWPRAWLSVISQVLGKQYVDSQDPADRPMIKAVSAFSSALQPFADVQAHWNIALNCSDFMRFLYIELRGQFVAPPAAPNAVELLGWLDIPLDDTPVTIVTSFNEGLIPSSDAAHPFLNQALRQQLHLMDNRRRYARDAYALELLKNSRKRFTLVVGRQSADGEPMMPSRLLMALPIDQLPYRAKFLFSHPEPGAESSSEIKPSQQSIERTVLPPLTQEVERFRATDFKAYLASPYRFYLERMLRLQSVDDQIEELTGGHFGTLLHNVLERFGEEDVKDSADGEVILRFLENEMQSQAKMLFGTDIRPSVKLQLTQAQLRLKHFAQEQAIHRRQGWKIKQLEVEATYDVLVDQRLCQIVGRIDRIDINENDGSWFILDYKTSDSVSRLDELYFKKKAWIDLQLPLYSRLVTSVAGDVPPSVQLGIIALPKKLDNIKFLKAQWEQTQLDSALAEAMRIIRLIRAEEFSLLGSDKGFNPSIERICQTGVLNFWKTEDAEAQEHSVAE